MLSPQLPLGITLPKSAVFDDFLVGDSHVAFSLCQQVAMGEGEKQLFLWGGAAVGKTHLLQACCHAANQNARRAAYFPLSVLIEHDVSALQSMEQLDVLCLDDIQYCAGNTKWEEALFHFINRCRESDIQLIFSANNTPTQLDISLADLSSRLVWGAVLEVKELSDADKLKWLEKRAHSQGLKLSSEVANYLLNNYARDMQSLNTYIEALDSASMAAQRALTVPFVKQVLNANKLKQLAF